MAPRQERRSDLPQNRGLQRAVNGIEVDQRPGRFLDAHRVARAHRLVGEKFRDRKVGLPQQATQRFRALVVAFDFYSHGMNVSTDGPKEHALKR